MQNNNTDERRLCRQVNIRMTEHMREDLEKASRANWTSASQFARQAVATELNRHRTVNVAIALNDSVPLSEVRDELLQEDES